MASTKIQRIRKVIAGILLGTTLCGCGVQIDTKQPEDIASEFNWISSDKTSDIDDSRLSKAYLLYISDDTDTQLEIYELKEVADAKTFYKSFNEMAIELFEEKATDRDKEVEAAGTFESIFVKSDENRIYTARYKNTVIYAYTSSDEEFEQLKEVLDYSGYLHNTEIY